MGSHYFAYASSYLCYGGRPAYRNVYFSSDIWTVGGDIGLRKSFAQYTSYSCCFFNASGNSEGCLANNLVSDGLLDAERSCRY